MGGVWRMSRIRYTVNWFRCASQATRDAIVIACISVPFLVAAIELDLFDKLSDYTRRYEHFELDELLLVLLVAGFLAIIYAWRRLRELKAEIRQRRAAEAMAVRLTLHDALTGLPNRHKFERLVTDGIISSDRQRFAVMLLRVDNFRQVIDRFGHALGDSLLVAVTSRLSELYSTEVVFARIGPNEFAIKLGPIEDDEVVSEFARRLIKTLADPFVVLGCEISITVTIGISRYPQDGTTAVQLLRRADIAKRHLAMRGQSKYGLFEQGMELTLSRMDSIESRLSAAIEADEIIPYFQPIVDLQIGRTVAFESLARWYDLQLGWVGPDQFIPIAEECGQIVKLGDKLLRKACLAALEWPSGIGLSLNISAVQLRDPTLGLNVLSALGEIGLSPWRLELELTETALVSDVPVAREILEILTQTGVSIALDDFGTGHSSLRHICDFSIHKLKIDQSFVRTMCKRHESEQVVGAVIGLARGLGIVTTAEGIENKAQRNFLRDLGCQYGQGFLFGRPMPAQAVLGYLADEAKANADARSIPA